MAHSSWVISDTHFSHRLMATLSGFTTTEEMDEVLISKWNALVKPHDRVYHLGDFCINRKAIPIAARLNGNIVLIKGNHDIFKLKDYVDYFDDIRAYKVLTDANVILSHIPLHPSQLWDGTTGRYSVNIHGHTHEFKLSDPRYVNACVEHTENSPVLLDIYLRKVKEIKELYPPQVRGRVE